MGAELPGDSGPHCTKSVPKVREEIARSAIPACSASLLPSLPLEDSHTLGMNMSGFTFE